MVEGSEQFSIKILTFDLQQLELAVSSITLISELKQQIFYQSNIPVDRQRLLYKGMVLKSHESLRKYNITRDSVLFLVANLLSQVRSSDEEGSNILSTDTIISSIENNQTIHISRRGRNTRRNVTENEKIETIKQNLLTIESMIDTINTNESDTEGFDYRNRKFVKGL